MHTHYCYILRLISDPRVNYIGYTVNMARRIRQHNGELVGGARITTRRSSIGKLWKVIALVSSEQFTHRRALSCEWWIKHPTGKRKQASCFSGSVGKIRGLATALANDRFVEESFTIWVDPEYMTDMEIAVKAQGLQHTILPLTTILPTKTLVMKSIIDAQKTILRGDGQSKSGPATSDLVCSLIGALGSLNDLANIELGGDSQLREQDLVGES